MTTEMTNEGTNEATQNETTQDVDIDTTNNTPEPTPEVKQEVKEPVDYSWVPAKFLKDGEPDWQSMSKSYTALEKKLGSKGAMAPDTIDAYDYQAKVEISPEFKEKALKEGKLSAEQYKWVASQYEQLLDIATPTAEKAEAVLRERWGDEFESKAMRAMKAYEVFVPSHISIEEIGNNPIILDILAQVGTELGEDTSPRKPAAAQVGTTKEDIFKLMNEKDYYRNKDKQNLVAEWYAKNAGK